VDGDAVGEHRFAQAVEQEARLASNGRTGNRAQQMADQRTADARVEHDRHRSARQLARAQPGDGALAGLPADHVGCVELVQTPHPVPGAVALLLSVALGQHRRGDRMGARPIAAGEAVAGRQRDLAPPRAGARAFAVGNAGNRPRRVLGGKRPRLQRRRVRLGAVVQPQVGRSAFQQPVFGCKAGEPVLRRFPRHRHGAVGQRPERLGREV
jgi:hypothetical protein